MSIEQTILRDFIITDAYHRYHCLFCDGYEDRGVESAAVLAIGDIAKLPPALHLSRMAKRLTSNVTVYVDGNQELAKQIKESLGNDPVISVDERRISRLEKVSKQTSEIILHMEDGTKVSHGFIVSHTAVGNCMKATLANLRLGPQAKIKGEW